MDAAKSVLTLSGYLDLEWDSTELNLGISQL